MTKEKKNELIRTIKFALISVSAGIIQTVSFSLLYSVILKNISTRYVISYTISIILSVIWNFTINRKYTFKSANNIPKAMALVFLFYLVFTPSSMFLGAYLEEGVVTDTYTLQHYLGWNGYIVLFINMALNLVLEYLYDRFIVFGKSIDTNDKAKKEEVSE